MATELAVEKQRFAFGDGWVAAFKYDDTRYYERGPLRCHGELDGVGHGTKAVDVVALHLHAGLLLLEVKDFRGYRIQNKPRLKSGEIAVEVALKIRDTVAGLIGAARQDVQEFDAAEI